MILNIQKTLMKFDEMGPSVWVWQQYWYTQTKSFILEILSELALRAGNQLWVQVSQMDFVKSSKASMPEYLFLHVCKSRSQLCSLVHFGVIKRDDISLQM